MELRDWSCSQTSEGGNDPGQKFFAGSIEPRPLWLELYQNLRDAYCPPVLPPLKLTSTPIPVPDRMAVKTNRWAVGTATIVNGGIVAIMLSIGLRAVVQPNAKPANRHTLDLSEFNFPVKRPATGSKGGGGGGANELTDPTTGRPPRFERTPVAPPQVPLLTNPKLAMNEAVATPIEVDLPDSAVPDIGIHQTAKVSLVSNGPGTGAGIGTGTDGGVGPGRGPGYGPGSDGGIGGHAYRPGGGVSIPVPIVTPEAEFSDEARKNKYQGVCMVAIVVDSRGYPRNLRIIQPLGMGLDERALEAVANYRFKPGMRDGKPVAVMMTVAVNFRMY